MKIGATVGAAESCTGPITDVGGENLEPKRAFLTSMVRNFALRPLVECGRSD